MFEGPIHIVILRAILKESNPHKSQLGWLFSYYPMNNKNTLLSEYKNGNYTVRLYSDGTKVKRTEEDYFSADFPDSIDLKITDYCDILCPMCHEKSTPDGKHANLDCHFLSSLTAGTELAIGGGNPLSHPKLVDFLTRMKEQGVICNLTVNQTHLLLHLNLIKELINKKLIYGLGVSVSNINERVISFAQRNNNVVLHLILGTSIMDNVEKLFYKRLKVLLLGYKKFGRGEDYYNSSVDERIERTKNRLNEILNSFEVVSFDNLALEQLSVKENIPNDIYEKGFMGNDGESTMYIDLVKGEFAVSSTATKRYKITDNIKEMFSIVKTQ